MLRLPWTTPTTGIGIFQFAGTVSPMSGAIKFGVAEPIGDGGARIRMNLRKLGLRSQIAIGFGSLLAIIGAMGFVGFRSAVANQKIVGRVRLYSNMTDITRSLQQAILLKRIGERDVLMGRDQDSTHLFEHGEADFNQALQDLKPLLASEEDRHLYEQVLLTNSRYSSRNKQVIALYRPATRPAHSRSLKAMTGWS